MFRALVAFAALSLAVPAALTAQLAPPAAGKPAGNSIPLYTSSQHSLIVVRIGDGTQVPLIFDTGTTDNILDTAFAATLGLPKTGPSKVVDGATGKPVPGYSSTLSKIIARKVERDSVPVQVTDFPHPDAVGVVGPYLFSGSLVALELGQGRIRIIDAAGAALPTGPAEPYLGPFDDALPAAHVTIAGTTLQAHLDSGSSAAVTLPLAMAAKLPLEAPPVQAGVARSASGEQPFYRARLKGDVRVGPLVLHNPSINFNAGQAEANIGLPVLRQLTILLDPDHRRLWITGLEEPSAL